MCVGMCVFIRFTKAKKMVVDLKAVKHALCYALHNHNMLRLDKQSFHTFMA